MAKARLVNGPNRNKVIDVNISHIYNRPPRFLHTIYMPPIKFSVFDFENEITPDQMFYQVEYELYAKDRRGMWLYKTNFKL